MRRTTARRKSRFSNTLSHAPVYGRDALAALVVNATRHIGQTLETRAFCGHVALARNKGGAVLSPRDVELCCKVHFSIGQIDLVESALVDGEVVYTTLKRFLLCEDPLGVARTQP